MVSLVRPPLLIVVVEPVSVLMLEEKLPVGATESKVPVSERLLLTINWAKPALLCHTL